MNESDNKPENRIALFQKREIHRTIHNNEWCFVVVDVVAALTDSVDPQGYIKDMRRRDPELSKGWGQIATPLSVQTSDEHEKNNELVRTKTNSGGVSSYRVRCVRCYFFSYQDIENNYNSMLCASSVFERRYQV